MSQRIPPNNREAEKSVLGSLLIDKNAVTQIADFLRPEHFYVELHSIVYKAMLQLYELREPIDLLTLSNQLKKLKKLKNVGGSGYIAGLAQDVPTSSHVMYYAKMVKDSYTKRTLISTAAEITEMAFDDGAETTAIMDKAEQRIFSLSQQNVSKTFVHVKEALADSFDRLDELQNSASGLRGIPTGFSQLDNMLAGFQDSNLIILAARPGMGKTALSLNICQHVTVNAKLPIGFFSLEMSKEELIDRLLVSQANIDAWKLKTGRLDDDEFARLSDAMGVLADSPLFIDDTPGMSVLEMRTKARRLKAEYDVKMIVVDYLTLAKPSEKSESRVQDVGNISMNLKNLARELKIPVIALSQLNRGVEHRGNAQPLLADLRESGSIEQDADVVMFLYREDPEIIENVSLLIAKHRNGAMGTVPLRFVGNRIKFFSVDRAHGEG